MVLLLLRLFLVGEVRRALVMAFCGGGERLKRILGCASSAKVKQKSYIAYFRAASEKRILLSIQIRILGSWRLDP